MLHEVLLSLAGHPSPLLRSDPSAADADKHPASGDATAASAVFTPPERELLASVSHLSGLHIKLRSHTAQIAVSHPSTICRAVAASISSVHLAAFLRKVLEVEDSVLRRDAALVGAYNIVPLTAVVGEFSEWTRRMEWLWEIVKFMLSASTEAKARRRGVAEGTAAPPAPSPCTGASIIDRLRSELQTGYLDIETTAASLVAVAETAWLKQVSAWILYGRLPTFASGDFFVQRALEGSGEDFVCEYSLLPSFVTPPMASSMLFIGLSLNQIRAKRMETFGLSLHDTHQLSSQLSELSKLKFPLDSAALSRTIASIRNFLSKNVLLKFLPLTKVIEILQLLRDFFLLARGEFAMALSQQADEKLRNRWRKTDNLNHPYGKLDRLGNAMLKEGEVMQILSRTWGALGSLQGQHAEEDEGLELARDIMRLTLAKARPSTPGSHATPLAAEYPHSIVNTPFRNLLLSVPVVLTLHIPSPLDLFLSQTDLQAYTLINSYLLSIRRAHLRLTDLWKISALRRHWPPPPSPPRGSTGAGRARTELLRTRHNARSNALRSAWANISAAVFFLAETEAYLQTEVVAELWEGFQNWLLTGNDGAHQDGRKAGKHKRQTSSNSSAPDEMAVDVDWQHNDDIWLVSAANEDAATAGDDAPPQRQPHDPQTLATAHRLYLRILARRILLVNQPFADVLYELLVNVDHLVALVYRLDGVWTSVDLEVDSGVVDAFVDLEREEADIRNEIVAVERRVRIGVEACVKELRDVEACHNGDDDVDDVALLELGEYVPRRTGGVDRLLMKLEFGSWFRTGRGDEQPFDEDDEMG